MEIVLNEYTGTVHKHRTGTAELQVVCGATYHLDPDKLRRTSVERARRDWDVEKCGRCFDDGGGY